MSLTRDIAVSARRCFGQACRDATASPLIALRGDLGSHPTICRKAISGAGLQTLRMRGLMAAPFKTLRQSASAETPDPPATRRCQSVASDQRTSVSMGAEYDAIVIEQLEFFGVIVAFHEGCKGLLHMKHIPLRRGTWTGLLSCLLYTSDAADE